MKLYYRSKNKEYAQENRNQYTMTEAEWKLRNLVLKKDKLWYRFLRQKLVWNYILDFYCQKLKLWIEIDDKSHDFKGDYDQERNNYLENLWIQILRYTNNSIYYKLEWVVVDLEEKIRDRLDKLWF
jgi:very-short-patch-repair endonuclease